MRLRARLERDWRFWKGLNRTLKRVKTIAPDSDNLICDDLQAAAQQWRDRPALTFEDKTLTYGEMDAMANRYASWAKSLNLRRGQTVALIMPNRLEYFPIWYGLSKVGVITALINTQLSGPALAHCLNISGAGHVIVDDETASAFETAKALLEKHTQQWLLGTAHGDQHDLKQALKSCSQLPPDKSAREDMTARDTALYIYTSGTTGLPKAARITHARVQTYMRGFAGATGATDKDRIYVPLPLYHATGGLCGLGAALLSGGSAVIKARFSASQFWPDIVAENCTMFVYIGELCRYLVNQPPQPDETRHKLRLAFGNGLRGDVWTEMRARFRLPNILEFYGSTEGTVSLFNWDGKVGAIGRVPKWLAKRFNVRLIQFDVETDQPVRGLNGLCLQAGLGQVGECIGQIGGVEGGSDYTGYVDKKASELKVLRDVFARGDAWFRTGDLMKTDADGYFYFIDRIGDTFRWKGENVSTAEIEALLQAAPGVREVDVYGVEVPGTEGRAGMAALVVDPEFDLVAFGDYVGRDLPSFARPVFLRLLPVIETTGTFKHRKMDLVTDGFNPKVVKDPLFRKTTAGAYEVLSQGDFTKISNGKAKL